MTIRVTPFEQAQRSWARSIASYADVPPEYRRALEPVLAAGAPFPLVVLTPSYEGFLRRETEKLVCASSDEVAILERRGNKVNVRRFPIGAIRCVEVSSILLDARFKIEGLEEGSPIPASASVRYNAVTDFLVTPIVMRIRSRGLPSRAEPGAAANPFQDWGRRSYKFMNFARRSLIGNEPIHAAILQPEIRVEVLSAFGRSYRRTISPTHATILTDRELITIREVPYPGRRERYGGIWDYMPLALIETLSVTDADRGVLVLSIEWPGDAHLDLQFEAAARASLDALVAEFPLLKAARRGG
jgi:hypothetical protein